MCVPVWKMPRASFYRRDQSPVPKLHLPLRHDKEQPSIFSLPSPFSLLLFLALYFLLREPLKFLESDPFLTLSEFLDTSHLRWIKESSEDHLGRRLALAPLLFAFSCVLPSIALVRLGFLRLFWLLSKFLEWFVVSGRGAGLMRTVRGMQKLVREEQKLLGWKKSFSRGIGITAPKVRTRDKQLRGGTGSSSNPNRSSVPESSSTSVPQSTTPQISLTVKEDEQDKDVQDLGAIETLLDCSGSSDDKNPRNEEFPLENAQSVRNEIALDETLDREKVGDQDAVDLVAVTKELGRLQTPEGFDIDDNGGSVAGSSQAATGSSYPPPPPVPPPKPLMGSSSSRRTCSGGSNAVRIGSSRRAVAWPVVSTTRPSPSGSRPSSPRSYGEAEGYNSADEHGPCFGSFYNDAEKECQFELDIWRAKGLVVKRMLEDGNCLFRAVADQVYGDTEAYDLTRQMCIDYMERERDHFSQFIKEGFTSYCKRKRRDKWVNELNLWLVLVTAVEMQLASLYLTVYGNNVEIQALSEMYNRPIHIYSYSTDPCRLNIGAGLGFSSLRGANVDKDQVKAAIREQQDQQINNALLAEARFYSDLELTEKEIERMVMEASRAEYLAEDKFKQHAGFMESSTSCAEPSSSGATTGSSKSEPRLEWREGSLTDPMVLSTSMQILLSMGFSYLQVIEAYSIFGDDVDSMVSYILEMGGSGAAGGSRSKGKATE
ncbi:hypothetical protein ACLOJK_005908 [Asimina triloba]